MKSAAPTPPSTINSSSSSSPNLKNLENVLPLNWEHQITEWLKEDIPSFDFAGYVVGSKPETATLLGKSPGILAGVPFFNAIFSHLSCSVSWHLSEGSSFTPITLIATVHGPAKNILLGERLSLNILARCSGIATRANQLNSIAKSENWQGRIAGTRKTTPGFRVVEKYGMLVGGCDMHRYDLSSMVMLKDNHVVSAGGIGEAVRRAREVCGFAVKIEVECGKEEEAEEGVREGADVVMLDNFGSEECKGVAKRLKEKYGRKGFLIEASGGMTVESVKNYFSEDVDVISLGALSQSVPHVDFSLKIVAIRHICSYSYLSKKFGKVDVSTV
eukprot:TRINITY_DN5621_c0_g1_i1.p1 TRINITY_DN5621_c0_g1~~TRINITY_DN5621_c0_g1_i1.p1  ORF type:complete len:330 (-),score=73.05 TRINITY_DN5621_c0_g1_i1:29-1018(-)